MSDKPFIFSGFIPMNKESIFEEPEPLTKTFGIVDKKAWLKFIQNEIKKQYSNIDLIVPDNATAQYLSDYCNIDGFMTQPTALYQGRTITAFAEKVTNIEDFINLFNQQDGLKFLYHVRFHPSVTQYHHIDPITFELVKNEKLEMTEAYWTIRFATLEGDKL